MALGLSCSEASGILPDLGMNLCLLHWQADSLPLSHQGSLYHTFIIHSSVEGHLGCSRVVSIVNGAAVNTGVLASFQIMVFSRYTPRSGIAGS